MPDPTLPERRSIRLHGFDYSQAGQYFLTICIFQKRCILGRLDHGNVCLSRIGRLVRDRWLEIPAHFKHIELEAFVVMPNHLHGILTINERARHAVPLQGAHRPENLSAPVAGSIPTVIRSFKSATSKQTKAILKQPRFVLWQRGYYERVLRSSREFLSATCYIQENPANWARDEDNPLSPSV